MGLQGKTKYIAHGGFIGCYVPDSAVSKTEAAEIILNFSF